MNRFRFVNFCEYINSTQRDTQNEDTLAPYLCLGTKDYKFLHYKDQGGSICVGCSAILCMLVHNANLSRDTLFCIPLVPVCKTTGPLVAGTAGNLPEG